MIELNSDTLPKVLVNQSYYAKVSRRRDKDSDKSYLTGNLQTATWLIRALDQRAKTILKVATEIVNQQDAFFAHGVQHLRPLNLKTVADAISMHESTVSRVTANKYMATIRGIFELKYSSPPRSPPPTAARRIRRGGAAPDQADDRRRAPDKVLSDDTIVDSCATPASTSRAARSPSTARRCASRPRCSAVRQACCRSERPLRHMTRWHGNCILKEDSWSDRPAFDRRKSEATHAVPRLGKNIDVGEALRERVSARIVEAIKKYFDGGYLGSVTVGKEAFGFRTECAVHLDSGITLHAEAMAGDAYSSADQAADPYGKAAASLSAGASDDYAAKRRRPPRQPPRRRAPSYVIAAPQHESEEDGIQPGDHRESTTALTILGQRSRDGARHDGCAGRGVPSRRPRPRQPGLSQGRWKCRLDRPDPPMG